MNKYDPSFFTPPSYNDQKELTIESSLDPGEYILWKGKQKKKAYLINSFFKMMPFAIIWLLFDGGFITMMFKTSDDLPLEMKIFLGIFFLFHLLPVWIWLSSILTANKKYKKLEYAFTNKRIIIKSGVINTDIKSLYYLETASVNLKIGFIDRRLKVGDIYINSYKNSIVLYDLENPQFITQRLQRIVSEVKEDVQFNGDNHRYY